MFDLFLEGTKYYDYPSFEVAIYSLLLALVLSSVLAFIYKFTSVNSQFSKSLFQGMVLSSLVTSTIMMAVGSNLAVGFGIIGAVAIIRFRTNIQNPRNIIFMFAALAVGIATGVYGYAVAVAGTITFGITAILLNYSNLKAIPHFDHEVECAPVNPESIVEFRSKLKELTDAVELVDVRQRFERLDRHSFLVKFKENVDMNSAFEELSIDGIQELRINVRSVVEQL